MPVLGEMWEERGPFRATPLGERKAERVWGRESWNFPISQKAARYGAPHPWLRKIAKSVPGH
jgi:hypothetical protein